MKMKMIFVQTHSQSISSYDQVILMVRNMVFVVLWEFDLCSPLLFSALVGFEGKKPFCIIIPSLYSNLLCILTYKSVFHIERCLQEYKKLFPFLFEVLIFAIQTTHEVSTFLIINELTRNNTERKQAFYIRVKLIRPIVFAEPF